MRKHPTAQPFLPRRGARQRLPLEIVRTLARRIGHPLSEKAARKWLWRGRRVKLVDGSGLSMPDTPENQAAYPLVRSLLKLFSAGDVMLADALYCNYVLIAAQMRAGVDVLFEQNGSRITDFRRGRQMAVRDHIVRRPRPARPESMTSEEYAAFPKEIELREVKAGHQILVTTLLDHRRISKGDLSQLYARRWHVELDLRNLKTTTGMYVSSCQTPQMNEKQLWVHLLAYNLIRLVMAQAARTADVDPRELILKHTLQLWTEWAGRGLCTTKDSEPLLALIAQCKVGQRPGRIEPRMRKRRPKPYPWLKVPRVQARREVAKHGHVERAK